MKADGSWVTDIQDSAIATTPEQIDELEALAAEGIAENLVVDVYPIVVVRDDTDKIVPELIRERMRTEGPSIVFGPAA